jgi:tetratricopeptide (TPR) repeat protein
VALTQKPLSQRQNAQAMVSAAVTAYRTGDLALAEQLLLQAAEIHPNNPDALQLLGLVAKSKGDRAGAEALMRKSLAADKRQPHVHHNLASLLKDRGALQEALSHDRQALKQDPNYIDALIQSGEILAALERFDEADAPLRRAYGLRPDLVAAVVSLAYLRGKTGKLDEAESLLRDGLARHPDNPYYRNNLGQLLTHRLKYAEAVQVLQPLVQQAPRSPEIFVNLGNALVGAGRLGDAVNHYLKAIELDPLNYFAHSNVNDMLWQLGRKEDIGKSFVFAKQAVPDHPDVLEMSAECMIAFKRFDEAEADLAAARKLRPGSPWQYRLWTALRLAQGRPLEAIAAAEEGLNLKNTGRTDLDLLRKLSEACLMADRPRQALEAARRLASFDPMNQYAAAYEATALRLLGETAAARRLYDYERFVHAVDLPPPAGFAALSDYHRALSAALDKLHHAKHEPIYQTLRQGTQTHENLFSRPGIDPTIAALGEQVLAAAEAFMASLPDDPAHPFLGQKGQGMAWSGSWSVRLREGGYHTDHIHHEGWISGCYYVETPPCLEDEAAKTGWIKFGEFKMAAGPTLAWDKAVRPHPGLVVFFPSYMWHGTIPITGSDPRLTVAFDIIPAKRAG